MTGWGNVARAVISKVLTAFLRAFAAELQRELAGSSVSVTAITPLAGAADALGDAVTSYVPVARSPGRTIPVS
jgi:hypothetical protein